MNKDKIKIYGATFDNHYFYNARIVFYDMPEHGLNKFRNKEHTFNGT